MSIFFSMQGRAFLVAMFSMALLAPAVLTAEEPAKPTTTAQALEGEALEDLAPVHRLMATFCTYPLELEWGENEDGTLNPSGPVIKSGTFLYKTRSWAENGVLDDNFLGPVVVVEPGQTVKFEITNKMNPTGEYAGIGPPDQKPEDWLPLLDRKTSHVMTLHDNDPLGYPMYGTGTNKTPLSEFYIDEVNIPGNYNFTNLHLHGMEVTPHLFEPVGTLNPEADYITIKPGETYNYTFKIPEDHPTGTFWYHPHRHHSVAIQAWSGMAGLLIVKGTFDKELAKYGITTMIPFAVHDPHYVFDKIPEGDQPGVARVAPFLADQNDIVNYTFLVTGRYRPEYTVRKNEIVHIRHLTATIENLSGFRLVKRENPDVAPAKPPLTDANNIPFYIVGSDGIAYDKPIKRKSMACGGGERHELLLQFPEAGVYDVWSDNLETLQFYGTGPKNQRLASFRVTGEEVTGQTPIEQMTFTPGIPKKDSIKTEEVMRQRHIVFDVDTNTLRIPFPQFKINDRNYRPTESWFNVKEGDVEEWIILNPSSGTHPFHIHVIPFQVLEARSDLPDNPKLVPKENRPIVADRIKDLIHIDYPGMWRDTMLIPAQGMLRIRIRFPEGLAGKTVLHCHFLAHEETGMIQNFTISPKKGDTPKDR